MRITTAAITAAVSLTASGLIIDVTTVETAWSRTVAATWLRDDHRVEHIDTTRAVSVTTPPVDRLDPVEYDDADTPTTSTTPSTTPSTTSTTSGTTPSTTPTVAAGLSQPVASVDPVCGDAIVAFADHLLAAHGIAPATVDFGADLYYSPGTGTITVTACARRTEIAHELGHYVMDRYHGYDWDAHAADATATFCLGLDGTRCTAGWIRGNEKVPGVEHAAHCIGHVLYGHGAYTKCPDPALLAAARARVAGA